ncbi:MAG: PqqD family protein [Actinomycetota bacterium]
MSIAVEGRPLRKPEVWLRRAGEENAVYHRETATVHLLNDTAMAIWYLCDGETTLEEMVAAVCDVSGLHADLVTEDVHRILGEFDQAGLLIWRE